MWVLWLKPNKSGTLFNQCFCFKLFPLRLSGDHLWCDFLVSLYCYRTDLAWHSGLCQANTMEVDILLHIFSFSLQACGFVVWCGTRGTFGVGWPRFLVWGALAACCEVQRSIQIELTVLEIFLIPSWHHLKEEEKRRYVLRTDYSRS